MELFLTDALVAGLIIIFSVMIDEYANRTDEQFITLEKRRLGALKPVFGDNND